ncbi:MAG: ParB/RepB/Spo0J family partition protein [Paracoccaceae bacterium]|nr:ParB/RepB/Spo0J family partition protein [Paracoccaceae bacterium]
MSESKPRSRGLGRGLSALMADVEPNIERNEPTSNGESGVASVPIENIHPNPDQPRRTFKSHNLDDLANSIRVKGVLQPLLVRVSRKDPDQFEIVAGERRWRAAQIAQLHELPIIIKDFSDEEVLEVAIIENIQRKDLNAIEEAAGYRQLMDRFGHTQEQVAEALGKSRSHIANLLRLLNLPDDVKQLLIDGKLSSGHARALITCDNPSDLAKIVVAKGLSVRQTERLAKKGAYDSGGGKKAPAKKISTIGKDADTKALEGDLSAAIGMKVVVNHQANFETGNIMITYDTLEQLDDLCRILSSTD